MSKKFETICLCGSTRFKEQFEKINKQFTLAGYVVLMPAIFAHSGDTISPEQKLQLDKLHKNKIEMSDLIFVINVDGYIGESTRAEIEYAESLGKDILYLEGDTRQPQKEKSKPLGYLGGDIMTFGANLARQYEYDKFIELGLPVEVYSPVQNKSINDKSNMTEEENNKLAEKITAADIERLWNSDFVVMCPEQSAIGSMCETGCLFGWKYMAERLLDFVDMECAKCKPTEEILRNLVKEIERIYEKEDYFHYFDIRTNHLNEKDWRRSFSINQLLYGMVLYTAKNGDFETFEEIMEHLKERYGDAEQLTLWDN